ncbi:unnamed protein product [Rhizophagus irregularis]|uniref:Uncharacterized protein n=1 Tax=Rhizophagus irregularis TaxID=588596 RepID=A0A2N1N3H1_9GLOM|nr:hypothetical protein RhiirC2_782242 [Rhizophagus irregularis]CAB4393903.1 unnamed protein product [Rhizophagus irregularis]CAB5370507.1 unnamed protein product [Rhizophagus irregularis]
MDSTNLLIRNNNNNNAIFQTVFDLLISIIIPIVLCINVERSKRKRMQELQELKNLKKEVEILRGAPLAATHNDEEEGGQGCFFFGLIILSYITIIFGIVLTFYFCIIAYNATNYFVFMDLLIVNAIFSIPSLLLNICAVYVSEIKHKMGVEDPFNEDSLKLKIYFSIHFFLSFGNFMGNVILFFIDVYIDSLAWLPVLLPIFLIFFVGIVRYYYQITWCIDHKDNVLYSDFWRPIRIIGICSSLLLCAIVRPSVIWIKIYIMSQIISFALFDIMH